MSGWNRYDLEAVERVRREAVAAAEAILRGEVGIIAGARELSSLGHRLVHDWAADPDLVVFGALDSETDHLPVGPQRELWDPAVLRERDEAVTRIEAAARDGVFAACRNIIARFVAV